MPMAIIDGLLGQITGSRLVGIHDLLDPPLVDLPAFAMALRTAEGILFPLGVVLRLGSMNLKEGKGDQNDTFAALVFEPDEVDLLVLAKSRAASSGCGAKRFSSRPSRLLSFSPCGTSP